MYMSFFSQSNSLGASAQWARLICRNPESAQNLHSMWSSAQCGNLPVHSWFSELQEFPWQRGQAVPSQRSPRCLWPRNKGWSIKIGFASINRPSCRDLKSHPKVPSREKLAVTCAGPEIRLIPPSLSCCAHSAAEKITPLMPSSVLHKTGRGFWVYSHPQIDGKVNPYQFNGDLLFHLFGDDYTWEKNMNALF